MNSKTIKKKKEKRRKKIRLTDIYKENNFILISENLQGQVTITMNE